MFKDNVGKRKIMISKATNLFDRKINFVHSNARIGITIQIS
jgi:hypothetical protein